jgi:transposase, IS5 family
MPKQPAFPGLCDAMKKKVMRREQFLAEMDVVVPWGRLLALIAPHYPKVGSKGGRRWRRCCGSTSCRTGMP